MSSKAREAVEAVYESAKDGVLTIRESAFKKVLEALGEPPRNCDMGTAEEQAIRFDAYCDSHTNCGHCPLAGQQCVLAWSQMPYEEAKGGLK